MTPAPRSWIPPGPPETSGFDASSAPPRVHLRYEDIAEDGRMVLEALPSALGAVWRASGSTRPRDVRDDVIPILSRLILEGGEGPISVSAAAEASGSFDVARVDDAQGKVERIVLAMWASVAAPKGVTHGSPPPDAGARLVAGRVFAEHVYTRPFAAAGERRVTSLLGPDGTFSVPERTWVWRSAESTLASPEGATPIDDALVDDGHTTVFGLDHTDSNRHVNSLVYPRLVIEAALRRLAAIDRGRGERPKRRLARALDIAFRKPCFAGETARVLARAFVLDGRSGVTAAVTVEGDDPRAPPRCAARLVFDV